MPLIPPTWFAQRQAKAEPAGDDVYRLTGPNLGEWFIVVRRAEAGRWLAALRQTADGADVVATAAQFETPGDAWAAAFELYRTHVVT
ncbi:MAG TPA: hypothetical protein VG013_29150 [Gemmataceae bacterium]|jgi:hypothetical protein|nr:hypothetical protein [Gemmataceae bacterium]